MAAVIVLLVLWLFILAFCVGMYLFQAFGIYKMSKNLGFTGWYAFVPFAGTYAFGKVAETYVKPEGRPSAKFSKILLTLQIIMFVLLAIFIVLLVFLIALDGFGSEFLNSEAEALSISVLVIPLVFLYLAVYGLAIAYSVIFFVALWRVFAMYEYEKATLYLVLSIFFSFLYPIFLFVLRNKQPKFTLEQRLNIQQ